MIRKITIFALLATLLMGCGSTEHKSDKPTIFVTITPLKSLVEEVTCGDFDVEVLVPKGASPETYDPTARQLMAVNDAEMLFSTGLITFEQSLVEQITNKDNLIDLSKGISLLNGSCSHAHCSHAHGIDPHTWTSPRALHTMTRSIHREVMERYPDSAKYTTAAENLLERIEALDMECMQKISTAGANIMMIYHPAFTYYAADYGIEQVAIEQDGKEPSPRQLASLVETAKKNNIRNILIQPQYSADKVAPLATECGAEVVVTDPLAEDILGEIERVTNIICNYDGE